MSLRPSHIDTLARHALALGLCFSLTACPGSSGSTRTQGKGNGDGSDAGGDASNGTSDAGNGDPQQGDAGTSPTGVISIEPRDPMVTVVDGKAAHVAFKVKNAGSTNVMWSISRAEVGSIEQSTGVFTTGSAGGSAIITADNGTSKDSTTVTVVLSSTQNGATATGPCAAGGCGGVGGEGTGPAVSKEQKTALDGAATANDKLTWLYPYDGTVWPLNLLAPLLQWTFDGAMPADAIKLELHGDYYDYTGYFARPALLAAGAPFVRHPVPQDVWQSATGSAARASLTVKLTVLAGGKAYGPITQTWNVAGGSLKGTVYYQSYGTNLAKNYSGAQPDNRMFGGATLAITGGVTEPKLVAGSDGGTAQCRVCHTVSADGSRMIVQHGDDYQASSSYDLKTAGFPETPYPQDGLMGWAGLYPDGTVALGNTIVPGSGGPPPFGGANSGNSQLLDAVAGTPIKASSFTSLVTGAAMPMFSPSGEQVAFVFTAGPGDGTIGAGDESKLVVMNFDRKTNAFSLPQLVYQGMDGNRPGWPAFTPSGRRLVFQMDLPSGTNRNEYFATRYGNRGELWWVDLKTLKAQPLEGANGTKKGASYLPVGPNNHDHDEELAYEPTISPIASGGYAWVVFTSRRMYGNVATIDPTFSDPREHDLTATPTPKKLWVAAMDLESDVEIPSDNTKDPSHPAFYLPAQELLAGNSRGFWVPEPCRTDGTSCESGDQCCGGYCTYDAKAKANICGGQPATCSAAFDKCQTSSDCCDATLECIGGRCSEILQ